MSSKATNGGHKSIVLRVLVVAVCLYLLTSVGTLYKEYESKKAELAEIEEMIKESQLNVDEMNDLLQNGTEKEIMEKELQKNGFSYPGVKIYKDIG